MPDSNSVAIFSYLQQDVRTVLVGGEVRIVLSDIAKILGYRDAANASRLLREQHKGYAEVSTPSGTQRMLVVTEAGFNRLVIRSNAADAEQVQDWLTDVVMPQIRQTGSYAPVQQFAVPQSLAEALELAAAQARAVEALEAKVAADEPKVAYVDRFVADRDLLKLRTVAANLGVQESELRDRLIERRWIYRESESRWSESKRAKETRNRYSAYADKREYFTPVENHDAPRFKGETYHTLKVTPAGAEAIARNFGSRALKAVSA